jgi:hypothetical protein
MTTQPPQELFCMNCGPEVAVERRDGAVLRCPRCGDERQVPRSAAVRGPRGQRDRQVHGDRAAAPPTPGLRGLRNRRPLARRRARPGRVPRHLAPPRPRHRAQRPRDRLGWIAAAQAAGDPARPQARRPDPVLHPRLPRCRDSGKTPRPALLARHLQRDGNRRAPALRRLAANPHPALLRHQRAPPGRDSRADRHLGTTEPRRC